MTQNDLLNAGTTLGFSDVLDGSNLILLRMVQVLRPPVIIQIAVVLILPITEFMTEQPLLEVFRTLPVFKM